MKLGKLAAASALLVATTLAGCAGTPKADEAPEEAASGAGTEAASNDNFPDKPIELVVAWAAGGGTDVQARAFAQSAPEYLGQQINVVNLTGGSGAIGWGTIAHNTNPDGYQLGIVSPEIAFGKNIGLYDFGLEDFTLITMFNQDSMALAVKADSPYQTLDDFIEAAKANPGVITVGTGGPGNLWDLAAARVGEAAGIELVHVPYDGAAPAAQAVLGGAVDSMTFSLGEVAAQVEAGEMRVLALAAEERDPGMKDIPTFLEQDQDVVIGTFRGIAGPKGMDEALVKQLNDAFLKMAEDPTFVDVMTSNSFGIDIRPTDEFNKLFEQSNQMYGDLLELSQQ